VTRPRATRRPISVLRLLAGVAVVLGFLGSGSQASWSDNWSQLFLSTFTGVADGAISGTSVPAEVGKLTLVLPSGRSVSDVAPKTGIYSERLLLSDLGGAGDSEFGVDIAPTGDGKQGAWFSFDLRQETDCAAFGGDVSDGATVDMLCFSVNSGVVTVNDQSLKTKLKVGTNYHVDITLFSSSTYGDIWAFCLTNVDTGEQEWVCGTIDGGYRPVHSTSLRKHAGKTGTISVDSILLMGYQR
jgi:hypothetical protein